MTGRDWQIDGQRATSHQSYVSPRCTSFAQNGGVPDRRPRSEPDEEITLALVGLNPGVLAGYGLIALGLVLLLIGLVWSAGRRLRNLSDDPRAIRVLIVGGLVLAAIGVVVGALATIANGA